MKTRDIRFSNFLGLWLDIDFLKGFVEVDEKKRDCEANFSPSFPFPFPFPFLCLPQIPPQI